MNPSAGNIDRESANLFWQPVGRCDSFTRESILACTPPTSGVYGIFNSDCQIFIGDSANIREALLRHESETDFQQLKPTGFTFEICAAEFCKLWAAELIARFHPVLQKDAAFTEPSSQPNRPRASITDESNWEIGTYTDNQEFNEPKPSERQNVSRWRLRRTWLFALAAMLVPSAVIFSYFDMPAYYAIHKSSTSANPASSKREIGLRAPNAALSNDTRARPANQHTQPNEVMVSSSTRDSTAQSFENNTGLNAHDANNTNTAPVAESTAVSNVRNKWSVQISAAPAKDVADTLLKQLKAKGYDGYVVTAAVKGQTYYRVRVGQLDSREKAEAVRQSLARQEGYPDAYLTHD